MGNEHRYSAPDEASDERQLQRPAVRPASTPVIPFPQRRERQRDDEALRRILDFARRLPGR